MNKLSACFTILLSKNFLLATDKKAYVRGGRKTLNRTEDLLKSFGMPIDGMRYEYTLGILNGSSKIDSKRSVKVKGK